MGKFTAAPGGGTSDAASASASGIIELATNAEVQTGTDTARAVTPAGLRACTSTTSRIGVVELATDAEAIAGSDTARALTASNLLAKINEIVLVTGSTTLTAAQTGAIVYVTGSGAVTLPNACAAGTNFTVINNTGSTETVALNTNGALVSGLPNAAIVDHLSKTFICVDLTGSTSTWAVLG